MDINELIATLEKPLGKDSNVDAVYKNINKFQLEEQVLFTKHYIKDFIELLLNSDVELNKEDKLEFSKSLFFYLATLEKESTEEEVAFIIDTFNELGYGDNIEEYLSILSKCIESKFQDVLTTLKLNQSFTRVAIKRLIKYQYCLCTVLQSYMDNKMNFLKAL